MTKNQSLYYARGNILSAIRHLEEVKRMDLKSRKIAKASAKPKWTKSLERINGTLFQLKWAKGNLRAIPKRVN